MSTAVGGVHILVAVAMQSKNEKDSMVIARSHRRCACCAPGGIPQYLHRAILKLTDSVLIQVAPPNCCYGSSTFQVVSIDINYNYNPTCR